MDNPLYYQFQVLKFGFNTHTLEVDFAPVAPEDVIAFMDHFMAQQRFRFIDGVWGDAIYSNAPQRPPLKFRVFVQWEGTHTKLKVLEHNADTNYKVVEDALHHLAGAMRYWLRMPA